MSAVSLLPTLERIHPAVMNGKSSYDAMVGIIQHLYLDTLFINDINLSSIDALNVLPQNLTSITDKVSNTSSLMPSIKSVLLSTGRTLKDSSDLPFNISTTHDSIVSGYTYVETSLYELNNAYNTMLLLATSLHTNTSFINHISTYQSIPLARDKVQKIMSQLGEDLNQGSNSYANIIQHLAHLHETAKAELAAGAAVDASDSAKDSAEPEAIEIPTIDTSNNSISAGLHASPLGDAFGKLIANTTDVFSAVELPTAASGEMLQEHAEPTIYPAVIEENTLEVSNASEPVVSEETN